MLADKEETAMAIRFVPFATAGGRPININRGSVSSEPPPAIVLTKPAKTPAPISRKISYVFCMYVSSKVSHNSNMR